ncbi:MAG: hypothetical protein JWM24_207 [Solirubrobacterales bacterium]|nr:hypothetical protein [Solirubrobacterales bacterium]
MTIEIRQKSELAVMEPFHDLENSRAKSSPTGTRSAASEEGLVVHGTLNWVRFGGGESGALLRAAYSDFAGDDLAMAEAGRSAGIRGLNRAEQE